jgi:hypothetical protein
MEDHAATIRTAILRKTFAAETELIVPLRSSLVTTLAAKAVLHNLLNTHVESRRMAVEAVKGILSTTETMPEADLDYLDPVIGVRKPTIPYGIIKTDGDAGVIGLNHEGGLRGAKDRTGASSRRLDRRKLGSWRRN